MHVGYAPLFQNPEKERAALEGFREGRPQAGRAQAGGL